MNRVITLNGTLNDTRGHRRVGTVGVTFTLYASQEGGAPLWRESQTVDMDEEGRYTVLLGSTEKEGLPLAVFSEGKAQWLGVQVQGEEERPRVLLLAVPYALKAADADTIGGRPLSSFVLYEDLEQLVQREGASATGEARTIILAPAGGSSFSGNRLAAGGGVAGTQEAGSGGRVLGTEGGSYTFYGLNAGFGAGTTRNSFFGASAGTYATGSSNTFVGYGAGARPLVAPMTGSNNSFFGDSAGSSNTTGGSNSFFGEAAGINNSAGYSNSFFGQRSGFSNTTGISNTFVGYQAGYNNTTNNNSFFGASAGLSNTTGKENAFFGAYAGINNTMGDHNSFFGEASGYLNNTGSDNSFFGHHAGFNNLASANSFFGQNAGLANTGGDHNAFFGRSAGTANTVGHENAFFGADAGMSNFSSTGNSYFGFAAGKNSGGSFNAFFGHSAGYYNALGGLNSFFGTQAGLLNTYGSYNSFIGSNAGWSNTTEDNNTFLGAFSNGVPGITNATAVGYRAQVDGSNSLVLGGIEGLNGATANTNVGIGTTAPGGRLHVKNAAQELFYVGADGNIGIGTTTPDKKLQIVSNAAGNAELHLGGPGDETQDIFSGMGVHLTTGPAFNYGYSGSTFGRSSGFFNIRPDATAVAPNPSLRFMTVNTERMIITNTGKVGIGTTNPLERLHVVGNMYLTGVFLGPSDLRLKRNVLPLGHGIDVVMKLRPVSFQWKDESDGQMNLGLIAQEVESVLPEIVVRSRDEAGTMGINYMGLVPVLVKAVQDQQAEIKTLNDRIAAMESMVQRLAQTR